MRICTSSIRIRIFKTRYSDNIFNNPNIEQNPISSIDGATALKLDEQLEINTTPSRLDSSSEDQIPTNELKVDQENNSQGISIENASYIENNIEVENKTDSLNADIQDEYTPKLFSEENYFYFLEKKLLQILTIILSVFACFFYLKSGHHLHLTQYLE